MLYTSPIITTATGRCGSVVHASGSRGMSARPHVAGRNPRSPAQTSQRQIVAACRTQWSAVLTAAQRAQWNAWATPPQTGVLAFLAYQIPAWPITGYPAPLPPPQGAYSPLGVLHVDALTDGILALAVGGAPAWCTSDTGFLQVWGAVAKTQGRTPQIADLRLVTAYQVVHYPVSSIVIPWPDQPPAGTRVLLAFRSFCSATSQMSNLETMGLYTVS